MRIRPKRVCAVIWDYDGPLKNSLPHGLRTLAKIARRRGLPFNARTLKRLVRNWGLKGNELLAEAFEVSVEIGGAMYREWSEAEKGQPCELVHMARETLQDLRERGVVNTILTSRPSWALDHAIEADGIRQQFVHIGTTCDSDHHKPHHKAFDSTMQLLASRGIEENQCIFIGDTFVDIEAGRARAVTTFIVRTGPYAFFDHEDFDPAYMLPSVADLIPRLKYLGYL